MPDKYDALRLENQLCFPLYAASHSLIRRYRPHLDSLGLTYTQYIAMTVIWQERKITVKELGRRLFLDSGTLTPVLKCLEGKGYLTRARAREDERVLNVELTPQGEVLRDAALSVPLETACCLRLSPEEALTLHTLLSKILSD